MTPLELLRFFGEARELGVEEAHLAVANEEAALDAAIPEQYLVPQSKVKRGRCITRHGRTTIILTVVVCCSFHRIMETAWT